MENLIEQKITYIKEINKARYKVAELKCKKAKMKPDLWEEATGSVDNKKDYIKSKTADIDASIREFEADIEWYYNMIEVVNYKLVYDDE